LVAVLSLAVMFVWLWWPTVEVNLPNDQSSPTGSTGPAVPVAEQKIPGTSTPPLNSSEDRSGPLSSPPGPGNSKANSAVETLSRTVRVVRFLQELKTRFPEGGNESREIEALIARLFLNDWRLAAHLDNRLDPAGATHALDRILASTDDPDIAGILAGEGGRKNDPAIQTDTTAILQQHYERLIQRPGFARIASLVGESDPPRKIGLLTDASWFVARRSELNRWMQQEEEHLLARTARQTAALKEGAEFEIHQSPTDPASIQSELELQLRQLAEQTMRERDLYKSEMDNLHRIIADTFRHRFEVMYDLDGPSMINRLSGLELTDVATPDFTIPPPD
jgi:hypothetical protein